jgi:RNA polymerase sigma factor (sigma-70 family)
MQEGVFVRIVCNHLGFCETTSLKEETHETVGDKEPEGARQTQRHRIGMSVQRLKAAGRNPTEKRFEHVLEQYGNSFRRLAAAYERDPDLRQDLFQEIALAIWKALPAFRNQCSERTFFYRIAHNRAITHIGRSRFPPGDLDDAMSLPDPSPTPEANVHKAREKQELLERVGNLPLSLRQVVVLALEGLENSEIADVLGISGGNVAVRLHRARTQLTEGRSPKMIADTNWQDLREEWCERVELSSIGYRETAAEVVRSAARTFWLAIFAFGVATIGMLSLTVLALECKNLVTYTFAVIGWSAFLPLSFYLISQQDRIVAHTLDSCSMLDALLKKQQTERKLLEFTRVLVGVETIISLGFWLAGKGIRGWREGIVLVVCGALLTGLVWRQRKKAERIIQALDDLRGSLR